MASKGLWLQTENISLRGSSDDSVITKSDYEGNHRESGSMWETPRKVNEEWVMWEASQNWATAGT